MRGLPGFPVAGLPAVALATGLMLFGSDPVLAQVGYQDQFSLEQPQIAGVTVFPGPTRLWSVDSPYILPRGASLLSANLIMGSTGLSPMFANAPGVSLGVVGNGLNIHVDTAAADNLEVGGGLAAMATVPWQGRLDLQTKLNVAREGPGSAVVGLAGMLGGVLEVDANGAPSLGLQFGVPITKLLAFTDINNVTFALEPTWNLAAINLRPGLSSSVSQYLGLGFGVDLAMSEAMHFLADTKLGLKLGGVQTDAAIGFRYAFNRSLVGAVFLSVGGPASGGGLGLGLSWQI